MNSGPRWLGAGGGGPTRWANALSKCADHRRFVVARVQRGTIGCCSVPLEPSTQDPLVVTLAGPVRGVAAGQVEQFLGIPYAAPPVGALRWAPPVPPQPWTGERLASEVGPICLQPGPLGALGSEDCLSLNVYRPAALEPSERLPVMLWIHGGWSRRTASSW
jgi:para-nitrobenzyl esterase